MTKLDIIRENLDKIAKKNISGFCENQGIAQTQYVSPFHLHFQKFSENIPMK